MVIILGILTTVVTLAVSGLTGQGTSAACKTDAKTLRSAEEAVFVKTGSYAPESALAPLYLAEASTMHDVTGQTATAYTISPAAGSTCT